MPGVLTCRNQAVQLLTRSLFGVEVAGDVGLTDESPLAIMDRFVDMFMAYVQRPGAT